MLVSIRQYYSRYPFICRRSSHPLLALCVVYQSEGSVNSLIVVLNTEAQKYNLVPTIQFWNLCCCFFFFMAQRWCKAVFRIGKEAGFLWIYKFFSFVLWLRRLIISMESFFLFHAMVYLVLTVFLSGRTDNLYTLNVSRTPVGQRFSCDKDAVLQFASICIIFLVSYIFITSNKTVVKVDFICSMASGMRLSVVHPYCEPLDFTTKHKWKYSNSFLVCEKGLLRMRQNHRINFSKLFIFAFLHSRLQNSSAHDRRSFRLLEA